MLANLHDAALANDSKAIEKIKPGADLNGRDADGMTPLLVAARFGSAEALTALLAAGADVQVRDNVGMTALHLAALHNRFALIRPLVAAGLPVDCATPRGSTPLMAAAAGAAIKATEVAGTGRQRQRTEPGRQNGAHLCGFREQSLDHQADADQGRGGCHGQAGQGLTPGPGGLAQCRRGGRRRQGEATA